MHRCTRRQSPARGVLLGALLFAAPVCGIEPSAKDGQSAEGRTPVVNPHVVAGGGGTSSGGGYEISGTIGQAEADPVGLAVGGAFEVSGGFWPAASLASRADALFANGFED
jgi:hypothetical protein